MIGTNDSVQYTDIGLLVFSIEPYKQFRRYLYLHWKITIVVKMKQLVVVKAIANMITF